MAWKKVSQELSDFLAAALKLFVCQKKMMFGCPFYFVNNNMFTGLHQDSLFVRLAEAERQQLRAEFDEAAPFEPMPGMIMKEYLILPESLYHNPELFHNWLNGSYRYGASLPVKVSKARRNKQK